MRLFGQSPRSIAGGCIAISWILSNYAQGCGISWDEPNSHYANVDFQGHVHIVQKIGELNIGGGHQPLPIYTIFNSSYGSSPYAGALELPILESKIIQLDENTFVIRSPSGWMLPFIRTKDPNVLDGPGGMKAEISGDTITAWSSCGDKLLFRRGKIAELEMDGIKLFYEYAGNIVSEIKTAKGETLLKTQVDAKTQRLHALSLGLQSIRFQWGSRPIVQEIGEQRIIGRTEPTVGQILLVDGISRSFEFGVDAALFPTCKADGGPLFAWNPSSFLIEREGNWSYQIKKGYGRLQHAAIKRTNRAGLTESWHNESPAGRETIETSDGTRIVKTSFIGGRLDGKLRSIQTERKGTPPLIEHFSYDESGRLIRKSLNGNTILAYQFAGEKIMHIAMNGAKNDFSYSEDKTLKRIDTKLACGLTITREFDESGKLIKIYKTLGEPNEKEIN